VPLFLALGISNILEKIFFLSYKSRAKEKLSKYPILKIIAITASYGKTSIKNFLYEVLSQKYKCYKTPRSVNTLGGIIKDINEDIDFDGLEYYIVEAGAREQGDIDDIVRLLNPHYAILGQVGEQHIEYFKTLDNIIYTKMEILNSNRLIKGFVHKSVPILDYEKIVHFPNELNIISSNLEGLKFELKIEDEIYQFETKLLGNFNATNLSAVILMSYELGLSIDEIKKYIANISQVEHRLYKIEANGKIIIDDSFNGNFEGMSEGVRLCGSSDISGDKIILTPGIIESTKEDNIKLAKLINDNFDKVIITSELNLDIFKEYVGDDKLDVLLDKSQMQSYIGANSKSGDLILFANDAPSFI
jgi:UDP-N-acetylmuramoyl-tripeptide--D-alanyl-D-alanine ligase